MTIERLLAGLTATIFTGCYFFTEFDGLSEGGASPATTATTGGGAGGPPAAGGGGGDGGSAGQLAGSGGDGGSAGGAPCPPPGVSYIGLVMNELAPRGVPEDWIELYNGSSAPIPLCAVFITQKYDDIAPPGGSDRFTFGDATVGVGQYIVIDETNDFPFGLAKDEDERITLFAPDGTILDDTAWEASLATEFQPSESWARIPDASGVWERVSSPTRGGENVDLSAGGGGAGGS